MADWNDHLETIRAAVRLLAETDIPVAEMPDAAAAVREVERRLANLRRGWNEEQVTAAKDPEGEFGPPTLERTQFGTIRPVVTGADFRTVTTRSAKRTYNTAAILHGMVARGGFLGVTDALTFALREGLARVEWRWSDLQRYATTVGLPLRTVPHRIADDGDLDGPWVGEDWKTTVSQKAITGKDEEAT